MSAPGSPPPSRSAKKKQQQQKAAGQKSSGSDSSREKFSVDAGEEDWQMIAEAVAQHHQQQQKKPAAAKSKATVEEITTSDEEADAAEAKKKQQQKSAATKPSQSNVPKKGVPLTPTQRKALQKANKNPHSGSKKPQGGEVEVEDGDDSENDGGLINEEDEGVEGLSDEDDPNESQSDSDGEASWETDDAPQQKIIRNKNNDPKTTEGSKWSVGSILMWIAIVGIIVGLLWIRLQDQSIWDGIDPDDIDLTTKPPTEQEDYYHILGVERTAELKTIKANYRKLVLQTHPDKNPDCTDCIQKFQSVQRAYDVLSNKEKRSMYDTIETTYEVLQSETIELTSANFEPLVLHTDSVWVIQVYTDWHKSAIRFAQAWEEASQRYGKLVQFGRVHAFREKELTKRLPVKFGVIPTVVIYANGQFSQAKTFLDSSHQALSKLSHFIAQYFPNTVTSVPNTVKDIQSFLSPAGQNEDQSRVIFIPDFVKQAATAAQRNRKPARSGGSNQQRFQAQMLATNTKEVNDPSLTYKAIARKFQYAVEFGQVEQLADPTKWKQWIKEVSEKVKLSPPTQLPAILYQEAGETSPKWLTGDLNKDKLLKHMDGMHRRQVPWMNSHSYARHCVESSAKNPTVCVIALACQTLKIGDLEYNTFASGARALVKQQAFKNAPLQFAKVDVHKQTDMKPLCEALPANVQQSTELTIVVLLNHGADLYVFGTAEHQKNQQFDSWLNHVIKQDGKVKPSSAPYIPVVHIPDDVLAVTLPSLGLVFIPLKYLYIVGILGGLIIFYPIISKHFASFVYLVFVLSILVPGFELAKDVYDKYFMQGH